MAQIADTHADVCVFTSDNPRFENPETILDHMMDGLSAESRERCLRITDRYQAIKTAVRTAPKGSRHPGWRAKDTKRTKTYKV